MHVQIDQFLVRAPEDQAATEARKLCDPAARMAPMAQCEPMIAEMRATHTVQVAVDEPTGRGVQRSASKRQL
jgi:hypothetical protein